LQTTFQRFGQLAQQLRHFARDLRADARGVEAVGVCPDTVQALAHLGAGQVGQLQAVAARVRKGRVGAARAAELGIHLDDGAHIHHQHKGRAALLRGQGAGVVFRLVARLQQTVAKALGVAARLELFRLQHKVAAPVAVNAPGAGAAVAVCERHRALEHIALLGRGVRALHPQQRTQLHDKTLRRR
jgi:hypothetical protein